MAVTDSFVAFVLEQLDPLGPIASKRMFGGVGQRPRCGYRSEAQRIALRNSVLNALFWNRSALCPNWKYTFRPL